MKTSDSNELRQYASVVVSISHKDVDREFLYAIPANLRDKLCVGMSVSVPFGRGGKRYEGFVVGLTDETDIEPSKIKAILEAGGDKPLFSPRLLELARWMSLTYRVTLVDCLKCVIPAGVRFKNDTIISIIQDAPQGRLGASQQRMIDALQSNGGKALFSELENDIGPRTSAVAAALSDKGLVRLDDISDFKDLTVKVKFACVYDENEGFVEALEALRESDSPRARVMELLISRGAMAVSDIRKCLNVSNAPIEGLAREGLITLETLPITRNTVNYNAASPTIPPELTTAQQNALDFIEKEFVKLRSPEGEAVPPVLIHGVTGSGKTEIYMRLIERALAEGRQAIMLVPEISLTPQTVSVFLNRFGSAVSVTHSRLTLGERFDQWKKARDGQTSIMIGPRSALFTPFDNLGVIIIDEEHEKTYKSETAPKYAAKDVAIERGRLDGALVVLGSATPSVESYHAAQTGEMSVVSIGERINRAPPEIIVVDMRQELAEGNMGVFSGPLFAAMEENLAKNQQTILFLNRRGHSTFVSCRKCGYVMNCVNCSVNYTYHSYSGKLVCHYCGKTIQNPANCPQCGSTFIRHFGTGTQKIEAETKRLFPDASILRMDMDTTSGKHSHERILNRFRDGEAQILIGTQMIAKGLDFPGVTLVGIVAADLSLNNGDFRSGETTFQLLTQVAGRAGRANLPGRVFIQTYNPEHYSIVHAKSGDYEGFFAHEIALRRQMAYPPFTHVFSVLLSGEDEKRLITTLFKLLEIMKYYNRKGLFEMLGPAPAVVSKVKRRYRWKILVKCAEDERLKNFVLYCVDKLKSSEDTSGFSFNLTPDPLTIL